MTKPIKKLQFLKNYQYGGGFNSSCLGYVRRIEMKKYKYTEWNNNYICA